MSLYETEFWWEYVQLQTGETEPGDSGTKIWGQIQPTSSDKVSNAITEW